MSILKCFVRPLIETLNVLSLTATDSLNEYNFFSDPYSKKSF